MAPGARWTVPAAKGSSAGAGTRRSLYFFKGASVTVADQPVSSHAAIEVRADLGLC